MILIENSTKENTVYLRFNREVVNNLKLIQVINEVIKNPSLSIKISTHPKLKSKRTDFMDYVDEPIDIRAEKSFEFDKQAYDDFITEELDKLPINFIKRVK